MPKDRERADEERPKDDWDEDDDTPILRPEDDEVLPAVVERAFVRLGLRESAAYERTEAAVAMYRVMKVLGLSDADIAKLVLRNAGGRVEEEVGRRVNPVETRRLLDQIEDSVIDAAIEADQRLNLNGDLVRRVRDTALLARAGREDALTGIERGVAQGRELLRRLLRSKDEDGASEA